MKAQHTIRRRDLTSTRDPDRRSGGASLHWANRLLVILACCCASATQAAALNDFAHARTLQGGEGSLRVLTLDPEFYRGLRRDDLGDLRIFNAGGREVPMLVRRSNDATQQELSERPLTFFPLPERINEQRPLGGLSLRIERSGEVVQLSGDAPAPRAEGDAAPAYLIDLGEERNTLHALRFQWKEQDGALLARFRLSASDDLVRWRTLSREGVLSSLSYAGNRLRRDRVEVDERQRFLRLEWLSPEQRPHITAIRGEYRDTRAAPSATRWLELGAPIPLEEGGYRFDSGGPFPLARLELQPPASGMLYQGALWSGDSPQGPWRKRRDFRQYWLEIDGEEWRGEPVELGQVRDRHWRITLATPKDPRASELPQLRAAYTPDRLLFLAQGQGPFQVAYGSGIVTRPANELAGLIKELEAGGKTPSPVTAGEVRQLGGGDPPPPPFPWEKVLLWTVLLAGVGLLGWMARGLMRDLNG